MSDTLPNVCVNDDRAVVVIYGNCQAEFAHLLLTNLPSLTQRFEFVLVSNNVGPEATLPDGVERAVLYWEQHDRRTDVPLRDEVRARIPAACPIVRYPAMTMLAFWPFYVKDPRNRPEPGFPWGRYPGGDFVALEVAKLGLAPDRAFERYMERSRELLPDMGHVLAREVATLHQRDRACDVVMADVVEPKLRTVHQFWAHAHVTSPVIGEMVVRLLERSAAVAGPVSAQTRAELREVCERYPGQGEFQVPIHPLVIRELGLTFVDDRTTYRWLGQHWTFEEYIRKYIAYDREW